MLTYIHKNNVIAFLSRVYIMKKIMYLFSMLSFASGVNAGIYENVCNAVRCAIVALPLSLHIMPYYYASKYPLYSEGERRYSSKDDYEGRLKDTRDILAKIIGKKAHDLRILQSSPLLLNILPWTASHAKDAIIFPDRVAFIHLTNPPCFANSENYDTYTGMFDLCSKELSNKQMFLLHREGHLIKQHAFATETAAMTAATALVVCASSLLHSCIASIPIVQTISKAWPNATYYAGGPLRIISALGSCFAIYALNAQAKKYINQRAEDAINDQRAIQGGISILKDHNVHDRVWWNNSSDDLSCLIQYPYFSNSYRVKRLEERYNNFCTLR